MEAVNYSNNKILIIDVIEAHGGKIELTSEIGEGTIVRIKFLGKA